MTARRDSVFLSLLEHAQMNRIVLDEMDADIKFKEARKEAALAAEAALIDFSGHADVSRDIVSSRLRPLQLLRLH